MGQATRARHRVLVMAAFALACSMSQQAYAQSLVAPGAQVEKLHGDFQFTEGPTADALGNIYFTDIPANRIYRWSLDGTLSVVRESTGGANGLIFDRDGNLMAAEGSAQRLTTMDSEGNVSVIVERFEGKRLNSPNDMWIDARGGFYFTDPRYQFGEYPVEQDGEHVYYVSPDRSSITRVVSDMGKPNGVIGSLDGTKLYVADTSGETYVLDVRADATLGPKQLFAPQASDGMTMDERGNLYLTWRAGVTVYSPDGEQLEIIQVPEMPANVGFGGEDGRTLFITARTGLYSVRMSVRGAGLRAGESPAATVTGPVPVNVTPGDPSHDFIFSMSGMDLAGHGYIEEEFFIEGTANRYTPSEMETADVVDGGHPYKTRFIVRRPADPADFNGTVVIEWVNVTAGRDLDIDWLQVGQHFMRSGYAWIGLSAQRVGVDQMREWSPTRYGTLDVTAGGTIENDALSYDILTAMGRVVRQPGEVDPLGGLEVERLFATGHSQSAGRLAVYLNNVHPRDPVFDAVVVHGGGGRIRDDQDVKIWKLMAETDMVRRVGSRQPDTDTFRQWEVAGSSHVDVFYGQERVKAIAVSEGRDPAQAQLRDLVCDRPVYSRVPFRHVMHAAFDQLVRWVDDGTAPPTAPSIEAAPTGSETVFARDAHGNALGGIRLAAHAVPTATNTGINTGSGFCRLYGSNEPFSAATLATLYPTQAEYVTAVRAAVAANLERGYILDYDAKATIREAEAADIGRR